VLALCLTFAARLPAHRRTNPADSWEIALGLFNSRDHRRVAVVVTTDGRRVQVPLDELGFGIDVSLLGLLRSLGLGLAGLLGLITGSGEESGGTRGIRR
jgi:hypothetical protein